jgi:peroxiredoxin
VLGWFASTGLFTRTFASGFPPADMATTAQASAKKRKTMAGPGAGKARIFVGLHKTMQWLGFGRKAKAASVAQVVQSGVPQTALKVGDRAPNFTLTNATGQSVSLYTQLQQGPVVLTWYRGGWCPYCNLQLRSYLQLVPQLAELGTTLFALTPELPDNSLKTSEKLNLNFQVLTDRGLAVSDQFGLSFTLAPETAEKYNKMFDLTAYNGTTDNRLPVPATYVIDQQGVIRWAYVNPDYTQRAAPEDMLAAVRALKR